jgi:hypothetical protein
MINAAFYHHFSWMFHFRPVPDLGVLQGQLGRDFPQLRLGGGWKILAHGKRGHEGQEVLDLHLVSA